MSYIGEREINAKILNDDGTIQVEFKDTTEEHKVVINAELLKLIESEEKRSGGVTDAVRHALSTKFIAEIASLGLDFYMVSHIAQGIETLAHNLREKEVGKRFGVTGFNDIKLSDIIPE